MLCLTKSARRLQKRGSSREETLESGEVLNARFIADRLVGQACNDLCDENSVTGSDASGAGLVDSR
jgi:hypothetical protein